MRGCRDDLETTLRSSRQLNGPSIPVGLGPVVEHRERGQHWSPVRMLPGDERHGGMLGDCVNLSLYSMMWLFRPYLRFSAKEEGRGRSAVGQGGWSSRGSSLLKILLVFRVHNHILASTYASRSYLSARK
jgi:hypothetical protein